MQERLLHGQRRGALAARAHPGIVPVPRGFLPLGGVVVFHLSSLSFLILPFSHSRFIYKFSLFLIFPIFSLFLSITGAPQHPITRRP